MKLEILNLLSRFLRLKSLRLRNIAVFGLVAVMIVAVAGCGAGRAVIIVTGETSSERGEREHGDDHDDDHDDDRDDDNDKDSDHHGVKSDHHFKKGLKYYRNHKYKKAIKSFRKSIKKNPHNWESHYYLGLSLYDTGKFVIARERLEIARKKAPRDNFVQARIYVAVAFTFESVGRTDEAGSYFSLALKYQPGNRKARRGLERMRAANRSGNIMGRGEENSKRG